MFKIPEGTEHNAFQNCRFQLLALIWQCPNSFIPIGLRKWLVILKLLLVGAIQHVFFYFLNVQEICTRTDTEENWPLNYLQLITVVDDVNFTGLTSLWSEDWCVCFQWSYFRSWTERWSEMLCVLWISYHLVCE